MALWGDGIVLANKMKNNFAWDWEIPEKFNIGEACTDSMNQDGRYDQIAMIVEDENLGTSSITYKELAIKSSQFAELLKQLKVPQQTRILVRLPNCLDYPVCFLGAMKAGYISVPTSTLLTAKEIIYLAKDSAAEVLVTDLKTFKTLIPMLSELEFLHTVFISGEYENYKTAFNIQVKSLGNELKTIKAFSKNYETLANDPAYLVYTSGTTGYPKGVLHAHRALLGRKPASEFWFNFSDSTDRILHTGKFNWTYVLGSGLMDPLYLGKTVIVHEGKNDAEGWINLIKKHKATIFIGVPTIYRQILQKSTANKNDVKSLRHCMSAGEHLSDEVFDQWHARFALDIYEAVGMSEFSYYISQSAHMPIRPGSAGFPQPGHEIRLLNPDNLEPVKFGEEGMICVPENDPGLFLRYWNLAEETKKYRHDGWFFTGDYARFDKDGYLWFLGRKDDIIKSFGYRVSPYEIERVYKNHQEIIDCAAIGEEIGKNKILVVLYVILKVGSKITPNELVVYGRENLATYKAPKIVYIAENFPKTKNGKILRRQIDASISLAKSDIRL